MRILVSFWLYPCRFMAWLVMHLGVGICLRSACCMGKCAREGGCLILYLLGLLKDTGLPDCRDNPVSTAHLAGVYVGRCMCGLDTGGGKGHRVEGEEEPA